MIRRKVTTEVMIPLFIDKIKRRKVTRMVVVKAMRPRENLEQIKPAIMNMPADIASMPA